MAELLQEYVDSRGVTVRVDREQGVLRGVKLIGLESRNGRRYRETALSQAVALYEEAKVNVNHPKEGPLAPRDYQDRIGVIRGVDLRQGEGLYADLHFNPKHVLAEQLVWDAEHNPRNVGFSHNVLARLSRDGDVAVVEEITRVQSVDLVADPAATHGLFEQSEAATEDVPSSWDALTVGTLRLHRPDLLEELQSTGADQLRQQLKQAQDRVDTLGRRQRIIELLCEHQLPVPLVGRRPDGAVSPSRQPVSSLFIETLMNIDDQRKIEALIAERAELFRSSKYGGNELSHNGQPRSRDQVSVFDTDSPKDESADEFARSLQNA